MIINATDAQVQKMAALACQCSRPMGLGFLHFEASKVFRPEEFPINGNTLYLDYVQGRMVKFYGIRLEAGIWQFDDNITPDYQSWSTRYHSYLELFDSINN